MAERQRKSSKRGDRKLIGVDIIPFCVPFPLLCSSRRPACKTRKKLAQRTLTLLQPARLYISSTSPRSNLPLRYSPPCRDARDPRARPTRSQPSTSTPIPQSPLSLLRLCGPVLPSPLLRRRARRQCRLPSHASRARWTMDLCDVRSVTWSHGATALSRITIVLELLRVWLGHCRLWFPQSGPIPCPWVHC